MQTDRRGYVEVDGYLRTTAPHVFAAGDVTGRAMVVHEAVVTVRFGSLPRPIIDGRPTGFCKLIIDRELHTILGCHVAGERAVELAQLAATAMAAEMPVEQLALVPFSFPTYANALGRAAVVAAIELDHTGMWAVEHLVTPEEAGVTLSSRHQKVLERTSGRCWQRRFRRRWPWSWYP